jgi:hypothetical protein
MRAIIHHKTTECPTVKLEGAARCPGHFVIVPESPEAAALEDTFINCILTAVGYGYGAAQRGDSLESALDWARKQWHPD